MSDAVSRPLDNLPESEELQARIARLEKALQDERARAQTLLVERDRLREAYHRLQLEMALLRRRIFVAKAERIDSRQLELEFQEKKAALDNLVERLGETPPPSNDEPQPSPEIPAPAPTPTPTPTPTPPSPPRPKPKGRRDLRSLDIPEERIELTDPSLEGHAERIGTEEACLLGWRKAGPVRFVTVRIKYRVLKDDGSATIVTAPLPKRTFERSLAAPSLLAKILIDKYADGLPLHRQETRFERDGLPLDRGTMCRWAEDCGMTAGAVVLAMRKEAFETAFCIATDATGIAVQPEPLASGARQPCRKGSFFVLLADQDHVLFEYMPRETSAAVAHMLRGYSGFIQADAKSVYDILFRDADEKREEVGCWAHCRRKFYEAAIAKDPIAREALFRIQLLFKNEEPWATLPPSQRKALRLLHTKPLLDDFFLWAEREHDKVKDQRGLLRSAFGYALRQRAPLCKFLDDGRLRLDNNGSERELRTIAVGRKAWLFVGSDDHAEASANLFSLIASCKLHRLDPEAYLTDLFRVLAHWPRDRYIELAPKYWARTRARLPTDQLAAPFGELTIPPPEQPPSSC